MTNSKKIKNFFSNVKNKRINRIRDGFNVSVVWEKILLIFIVANIIIVIISAYLFFQINSGEIFLVKYDKNIPVETIDRTLLQDTIDLFEQKKIEFDRLKIKKMNVIDPSL